MNIGTAKPTAEERTMVPHHALDIISPSQSYSAARFKEYALKHIKVIQARDRLPIMVGGTGLYIDGVIFDFAFLPAVSTQEREQLQNMSVAQLQAEIGRLGLNLPANSQNPRHLMRVIETNGQVAVRKGLRKDTLVIGMDIDRETVRARISQRVDDMLKTGFVEEVKSLYERYGRDAPGLQAPGYRAFIEYIEGLSSLEQARQRFIDFDNQLAKRQRTWFKRNPYIRWIKNSSDAIEMVQDFLQR
jgi:tRNA dimethylallyltransferase